MEQLLELQKRDLISQLESGGFVRHVLDNKTGGLVENYEHTNKSRYVSFINTLPS